MTAATPCRPERPPVANAGHCWLVSLSTAKADLPMAFFGDKGEAEAFAAAVAADPIPYWREQARLTGLTVCGVGASALFGVTITGFSGNRPTTFRLAHPLPA